MTPTEKIDAALDAVLCAAGSGIRYYSTHQTNSMREAMRKIMVDSYIEGGNDTHNAMKGK